MATDKDDTSARLVPLGSCTWCAHKPHAGPCPATIRTGPSLSTGCTCIHHDWAARTTGAGAA